MNAHIRSFRYWKSENDETANEDSLCYDPGRGLFSVADGVGTTSFANIWADLLVRQFVSEPLTSDCPFEVEWWLRRVQTKYQERTPSPETLPAFAQAKAREGARSTLVTLRFAKVEADHAQAVLLAFGDSCVLIRHHDGPELETFPISHSSQFSTSPICVPSRLREFDREFHRCLLKEVQLLVGDTVILATDAVAKWIIGAGNGRLASPWAAFEHVVGLRSFSAWIAFIEECRRSKEMVDDDSTALILQLTDNPQDVELGVYEDSMSALIEQRRHDCELAKKENQKDLVAIYYGDGKMLDSVMEMDSLEIQRAREVASNLNAVLRCLRISLRDNLDLKTHVEPVWQKYATSLLNEPAAAIIRKSLQDLGIQAAPSSSENIISATNRESLDADIAQRTIIGSDSIPSSSPAEHLQNVQHLVSTQSQANAGHSFVQGSNVGSLNIQDDRATPGGG